MKDGFDVAMELARLSEENRDLRKSVDVANGLCKGAEKAVEKCEEKLRELTDQLMNADKRLDAADIKIHALEYEVLKQITVNADRLEACKTLDKEAADLREDVRQLEKEAELAKRNINGADQLLAAERKRVKELEKEVAAAEERIATMREDQKASGKEIIRLRGLLREHGIRDRVRGKTKKGK